jgi:hypothetical protein
LHQATLLRKFLIKQTDMLEDFQARDIYLTEDEYRIGLRALFPEDYQHLSDEQLEDILYDRIAQLPPSEAENFFEGLGSFFKKAASAVASGVKHAAPYALAALPAAATIAGTVFAGPAGGAAAGMAGNLAAGAISKATGVRPNQTVANIGQAATSIASGNYAAAIPQVINVTRDIGNRVSRGAGDRIAGVASNAAQIGTAIASRNYGAALSGGINASRDIGNMISPGAGNQIANVASGALQAGSSITGRQIPGMQSPGNGMGIKTSPKVLPNC